jgi:serine/threonine-protein kinase
MAQEQTPRVPGAFGEFWLEQRIGAGGTAEVFLARKGGPEGPVLVVKKPLPELKGDPTIPGLFEEEARLHRQVRHPGVVEVYGAGVVEGEPFLAMQYVDGIDAFRLLRRAHVEGKTPPEQLGAYVGGCLCDALDGVHTARDERGRPLGILHQDVTPSNVYLSLTGDVLLGDFGIARPATRTSRPQLQSSVLKGKHNYLAPEQINGEPSDHRADLFSCAVVIAELLLGKPLFAGAGQVAVLLAIREGRIDALRAAARRLSPGLFEALERALARDPAARYPSARAMGQALAPFEGRREEARQLLAEWVAWARDARRLARKLGGALLESEARIRQIEDPAPSTPGPPTTVRQQQTDELVPVSDPWGSDEPITARIDEVPSRIRFADGRALESVRFARLIEMVVTGELGPEDQVNLMEQGFRRVADIELLERHLPAASSTRNLQAPSAPDDEAELGAPLLPLLGRLARARETGLLLVEGGEGEGEGRGREIYLHRGALIHVASADASELLGQALVRQGLLSSAELDLALAVLPRFQGRLGDTLIALGLADPVVLFRAIETQGRERFLRIFSWPAGRARFFRGVQPSRLEFPLELDLVLLMLEGVAVAYPNDAPIVHARPVLGRTLRATPGALGEVAPPAILALLRGVGEQGMELRRALARLASSGGLPPADALRAMYVAIALGLCEVV